MKEQDGQNFESALKVNEGIEKPSSISPYVHAHKKRKRILSKDEYVSGILSGDRVVMSMAITLIESSLPSHYAFAQEIVNACLPHSGQSIRIGITGVPGVGKSTFIESFGKLLTSKGHKVAVLAIDPSSERSKGSILGDKTRMEDLSVDENAFIRPSPSAGSLGGVARKTREIIVLCEAAGFDRIIVETVGVGQSEISVHSMVDFFLLLMLSGAGDELQGIKRGIMEMADLLVVNKADGDNVEKANLAKTQYTSAMRLFPLSESKWQAYAETCSALNHQGIENILNIVQNYVTLTKGNGFFVEKRNKQAVYILKEFIQRHLNQNFYMAKQIKTKLMEMELDVAKGNISPYNAGQLLLEKYFELMKNEHISCNFDEF
jgi:LAO/AO transport system kinase